MEHHRPAGPEAPTSHGGHAPRADDERQRDESGRIPNSGSDHHSAPETAAPLSAGPFSTEAFTSPPTAAPPGNQQPDASETQARTPWPSEPAWPAEEPRASHSHQGTEGGNGSRPAKRADQGPMPWSPFVSHVAPAGPPASLINAQPAPAAQEPATDQGPHTPTFHRQEPHEDVISPPPAFAPGEDLPPVATPVPVADHRVISPPVTAGGDPSTNTNPPLADGTASAPPQPPEAHTVAPAQSEPVAPSGPIEQQGTDFMHYPPPNPHHNSGYGPEDTDEHYVAPPPPSGSHVPAWNSVSGAGMAPGSFPDEPGALERIGVTADDFARRRVTPPSGPIASMGLRGALCKLSLGLLKLPPSRRERAWARNVEMVRRNFGGLRQVTVVNPKGGAGKTVAVLMLAMTFGQRRGGYVLAWDNNETQGTLGMRAQQDFHIRTVRDLLRDLDHFQGPTGRVGDLSQYVRAQGEAMFDVLASDESATAGEMLTAKAFGELREAVSRFYKLIIVDTGNNVRAENWQSSIDATDQLVITMSARNDSAETAARALDHLEQTGRRELVRQAVTVVSMPAHRKDVDLPAVQRHFAARTRAVMLAPYEKLLDSGEPIRYDLLSNASRRAWLRITAAVAEGL
ncbi:MinD/ParA family ATP-binding protein [Natronoglycomyces albus]|uniref:Chromosome partitioning protein n=1 Tax=Natronoglycomyces albus TaxID=2811108 RepID=A0A895XRV6_9ACTN|nr:chromosome partitioning protein [Natronoglycomyces albus]QSB05296.1 chromosome partitioning protein [Natronoglycomyces albus]